MTERVIELESNKEGKEKKPSTKKDKQTSNEPKESGKLVKKEEEGPAAIIASNTFGITVGELETIMGLYKERGPNFADLKYFEDNGGVGSLLNKLKTDTKTGIESVEFRENDFGSNKVFVEPVPHFCSYVWEALGDLMIRILIVAAIVQIILGATLSDEPEKDWVDGLSIIIAILVVVLVGSITNWKKETKFHELNDLQNEGTKYTIIRDSVAKELQSDDILVGDIIRIMYGDIMPADLLLLDGNGIKMDESSLTGESESMKKEPFDKCLEIKNKKEGKPSSPLILSGTNCIEGTGTALILAVGDHSQKGIIKRTVDNAQENSQTPLEVKLNIIAETIGWFGMGAGIVTLIALFIRFGISFVSDQASYRQAAQVESLVVTYVQNNPASKEDIKIGAKINSNLTNPNDLIAKKILDIILLCVSIIVVAIPEGLPLAVTLSLAFSIKKLMDQNNLVRKMHACETMGGANYICTDKTGTLTKNEMNVYKVLNGKRELTMKETQDVHDAGDLARTKGMVKIRESPTTYFPNEKYWEILRTAVSLNIEGNIIPLSTPTVEGDKEICETKNKTDNAFIDLLYRLKSPISEERAKYLSESHKQFPFDSKRKRMTSFVQHNSFPTGYRLFSKGGAENVKLFCRKYLDPDTGAVVPLSDNNLTFIKDKIEEFNRQMLRSLYICYKDISKAEYDKCEEGNHEGLLVDQYDMTFIAVFGIRDSLRDGVKEAVIKCKSASVNVVMVTGDNIVTAVAIAKDCNILGDDIDLKNLGPGDLEEDPDHSNDLNKRDEHLKSLIENQPKALTGNSFYLAIGGLVCVTCNLETNSCKCPKTESEAKQIAEKTGDPAKEIKKDVIHNKEVFLKLTKRLKVMARSQPLHKYALVLGLKDLDHVVAVTGDGTNDAPALSKSDVGFAMFAGTDIAKEASDIVIMDNNFSSIVVAIIYGRNIYDNIRKFLQFQLTVNFCACLLVFICACIGNETPLTPIQMLWVNLIMDSLGSLALATEPPYQELLQREPTKRKESIINGKMWKHIILQSLIELGILLFLYLHAPHFIKEQDYVRLAETSIIKSCYGKLPGGIEDITQIIYGTQNQWDSKTRLIPGSNEFSCGKYASRQDLSVAYKEYINANGSSAHMSLVFNVFVIYTLFNQLNARVIADQFNIFVRIHKNLFFPVITVIEFGLQVIIIEFGNVGFHVTEKGLTAEQWGITIGFSAVTFVVSFIAKLIPIDKPIQNILDKMGKSNKVGNITDLEESDKDKSKDKLSDDQKNEDDAQLQVKEDRSKSKDDTKDKLIPVPKIVKGSSNSKKFERCQGSLRSKKADVSITNKA